MADKKRVLIVEDEKPLAQALKLKLEFAGFDVSVVDNGKSCMELVAKEKFGVILLDMMMPIMDGFKTLEALKKAENKTPVFTLSNLSVDDDVTKVLGMGAQKYFIKSDTPLSTIVAAVTEITK